MLVAWLDRTMAHRAMVWGPSPMSVMWVGLGCVELPPMFWVVCFGGVLVVVVVVVVVIVLCCVVDNYREGPTFAWL